MWAVVAAIVVLAVGTTEAAHHASGKPVAQTKFTPVSYVAAATPANQQIAGEDASFDAIVSDVENPGEGVDAREAAAKEICKFLGLGLGSEGKTFLDYVRTENPARVAQCSPCHAGHGNRVCSHLPEGWVERSCVLPSSLHVHYVPPKVGWAVPASAGNGVHLFPTPMLATASLLFSRLPTDSFSPSPPLCTPRVVRSASHHSSRFFAPLHSFPSGCALLHSRSASHHSTRFRRAAPSSLTPLTQNGALKGLYAFAKGPLKGRAFYGVGASARQETAPISPKTYKETGVYRPAAVAAAMKQAACLNMKLGSGPSKPFSDAERATPFAATGLFAVRGEHAAVETAYFGMGGNAATDASTASKKFGGAVGDLFRPVALNWDAAAMTCDQSPLVQATTTTAAPEVNATTTTTPTPAAVVQEKIAVLAKEYNCTVHENELSRTVTEMTGKIRAHIDAAEERCRAERFSIRSSYAQTEAKYRAIMTHKVENVTNHTKAQVRAVKVGMTAWKKASQAGIVAGQKAIEKADTALVPVKLAFDVANMTLQVRA